jgi:hypothetical protein
MAEHLDSDQGAGERCLGLRILEHRASVELATSGDRHRPIEPRPQLDLPGAGRGSALGSQRVHRDLPAVAEPPSTFPRGTSLLAADDVGVAVPPGPSSLLARSDPASGSEKPWHQISSADRIGGM